jgi:hypothetical protein
MFYRALSGDVLIPAEPPAQQGSRGHHTTKTRPNADRRPPEMVLIEEPAREPEMPSGTPVASRSNPLRCRTAARSAPCASQADQGAGSPRPRHPRCSWCEASRVEAYANSSPERNQWLLRPLDCLGPDREPLLGPRSWRRVDKAGHMIAVEPPSKFSSKFLNPRGRPHMGSVLFLPLDAHPSQERISPIIGLRIWRKRLQQRRQPPRPAPWRMLDDARHLDRGRLCRLLALGAAVGDDGVGVRLDQQFLGLREHHQRSGRPVLQ